jgi:hypothetical protein
MVIPAKIHHQNFATGSSDAAFPISLVHPKLSDMATNRIQVDSLRRLE